MYTIEKYIKNVKILANSLIIKINGIGVNNNIKIRLNPEYKPDLEPNEDKSNWKYYLNISGQYHPLDKPVEIKVIETEQTEVLTKELLENNRLTKNLLLECGDYYNELISLNSNMINYIHGCMYDIDIKKAIEAKDGTILAYNNRFIEKNEGYLIREIQSYVYNLMSRWYVKNYTLVDELYLSAFIGFLYASIYNKIFNIHLKKIGTNEVNSFHLEHFFRSHLDLWDDIEILNNESKYWLYKNLKSLITNTGKTENLNTIIKKIFSTNNIGVGEYRLRKPDPEYIEIEEEQEPNLNQANYRESEPLLVRKKLNDQYILNRDTTTSIESLLESQTTKLTDIKTELPRHMKDYILEIQNNSIKSMDHSDERTKTLDMDSILLFKSSALDIFSMTLDYWAYALSGDVYNINKVEFPGNININKANENIEQDFTDTIEEFTDYDNRNFKVTPKVGFLMALKLLLYSVGGLNTKLKKINYHKVLLCNDKLFQYAIDSRVITDGYSRNLLNHFKKILPFEYKRLNSLEEFKQFVEDRIVFSEAMWLFTANSDSFLVSTNLKSVFNTIMLSGEYKLTDNEDGETIDELLLKHDIKFDVGHNTDINKTLKLIIKTFTGVELDSDEILINNNQKYMNILNKLTSYSVQVINTSDVVKEYPVYYNNIMPLRIKDGLILNYGMNIRPLEKLNGWLNNNAYEFNDNVYVNNIREKQYLVKPLIKPIQGTLLVGDYTPNVSEAYTELTNIRKLPSYDFNRYKWFNDFIRVTNMKLEALEDSVDVKVFSRGDNVKDITLHAYKNKPYFKRRQGFKGEMLVTEGTWLNNYESFHIKNLPGCWFRPVFENFITVAGMNIKALEVVPEHKLQVSTTEQRFNLINKMIPKIKYTTIPEFKGEIQDQFLNQPIIGVPYQRKVLSISNFLKKTYVKVSNMMFQGIDHKGPDLKTITLDGGFFIKDENGKIDAIEIKHHNYNDPKPRLIYTNNVNAEGIITNVNIDKDFALGLAGLRYNIDGEESKLAYIGLQDDKGNVDVYNVKDVPLIDKENLTLIPHIDLSNQNISGIATVFNVNGNEILSSIDEVNEITINNPVIINKDKLKNSLPETPKQSKGKIDLSSINKPRIIKK